MVSKNTTKETASSRKKTIKQQFFSIEPSVFSRLLFDFLLQSKISMNLLVIVFAMFADITMATHVNDKYAPFVKLYQINCQYN